MPKLRYNFFYCLGNWWCLCIKDTEWTISYHYFDQAFRYICWTCLCLQCFHYYFSYLLSSFAYAHSYVCLIVLMSINARHLFTAMYCSGSLLLFLCGECQQCPLGRILCLVYLLNLWNNRQKLFSPQMMKMFLIVWESLRTGYALDLLALFSANPIFHLIGNQWLITLNSASKYSAMLM